MNLSHGHKTTLFVVSVAAVLSSTSGVWAQSNTVLAQSLFEQGRKLVDQGDYEHGCPKLAESQRLDPGTGTLLNLGVCYEKAGKTASAWATFEEARSAARKDADADRRRFAREHSEKLRPLISKLLLNLQDGASIPGLEIVLDGSPLPKAAWGADVPVDPGSHHVEVTAPKHKPWSTEIKVGAKADRQTITIPVLQPAEGADVASTTGKPETSSPMSNGQSSAALDTSSVQGGSPTLGYVIGGAGLVALGAGAYFGLQAMSSWDSRNNECDDSGCSDEGIAFGDDTLRQANISNVAFGVGLIGVGLGTYLILTSSSSPSVEPAAAQTTVRLAPAIGTNGGSLSLTGAW